MPRCAFNRIPHLWLCSIPQQGGGSNFPPYLCPQSTKDDSFILVFIIRPKQTAILILRLFSPAELRMMNSTGGRPHPCMRHRLSMQRQHKDLILRCTMARAGSNSTLGMASLGRIRPKTPTPPNEENSTSSSPQTQPRANPDSRLSSQRIVPSCSLERARSCRTLEPLLAPWSASPAPPDTSSPLG